MYDKPQSQYSKLVMAARKAEIETPGRGVSEVRAKSAVVELATQPNANTSEPQYEAIMQQTAYFMSSITNQNASNNGQNGVRCNNENGKFPNTKTQRPKKDQKICFFGDADLLDMGGGNVLHLDKAAITLSRQSIKMYTADGGGNTDLQSSYHHEKGGININGQLRQAGMFMRPEYYNPNPLVRILGRANESEIEIDGVISKALIDSGAMISMMSKEYCEEQPVD